jgi:hypothetical protein
MGYESIGRVFAILAERGRLPPYLNQLVPGRVCNYLAALVHQSTETLSSLSVHHYAPSLVLVPGNRQPTRICDSKTLLRYVSSSWPVCPACLRQDEVPYERLLWSFRPVPVCVEHGCILVSQCPACQRPLRWDRQDVSRCRCGQRLGDVEPLTVSSHGQLLARTLHESLTGGAQLLPEMSVAACFWWIDGMATAIGRFPAWMVDAGYRIGLGPQQHGDAVAWLAAVESVGNWPHNFTAFLDVFQQIDKQKTTSTGVGRRFGTLLRHAAKLEELGYAAPAEALRDYLVEHYAGGHLSGKVCLFKRSKDLAALRQRAWISQTSAAKMLGLRHGAVARLLQEGILKGQLHPAGQRGRSVGLVHRDSVESLQRELRDALSVKAAAKRLGIGRHGVLDLIHGGSLPRAVRTAKGWQIPRTSVADLEDSCQR